MFFVRFTTNPQADFERGFSFAGYQLFAARSRAVAEFVELHGDDVELIAQDNVTGMWGRRLSGLCGFGPFDTAAAAETAVESLRGNYTGQHAIFAGVESWNPDIDGYDDEGTRFIPTSII